MDLTTFAVCQPYPDSGPLRQNLDASLDDLRRRLLSHHSDKVYAYVMTTVQTQNGVYCQKGCGPNFQGGVITICSCKAQMRTYKDVKPGVWLSGFTGALGTKEGNGLFYLTRIQDIAVSQYELWNKLPPEVRIAKAAHLDPFGDVFEPTKGFEEPDEPGTYDVNNYKRPINGHVHAKPDKPNRWHLDIDYVGKQTGRRQAFLIGGSEMTFIWTRPLICFHGKREENHPRSKKRDMPELLEFLGPLARSAREQSLGAQIGRPF